MSSTSVSRPMPVRRAADALFLLGLAAKDPLQPALYTFFLDADGVGGVLTEVSGADHPDAMVHVVQVLAHAAGRDPRAHALIVASVRPHGGLLPGDIDRWMEADAACARFGLTLIEWFVISPNGVECPRHLLGEPERWPVTPRGAVGPA